MDGHSLEQVNGLLAWDQPDTNVKKKLSDRH
jgi:hypothetical protein